MREQAISWWRGLTGRQKTDLTFKYLGSRRNYWTVTGREIEDTYRSEMGFGPVNEGNPDESVNVTVKKRKLQHSRFTYQKKYKMKTRKNNLIVVIFVIAAIAFCFAGCASSKETRYRNTNGLNCPVLKSYKHSL